ncbi:MAG: hypothetical protein FJ313_00150 [Gemmatimonadetes bacterium]|nr:hypothetical protein [Gemmatimonadota bacterium]
MRIGWFSTGRGEGSRGLLTATLAAIDDGRLDAEIEFVFCNRDRGQHEGTDRFLDIVEARGIPLVTLSSQGFRRAHGGQPWAQLREEFDRAAMEGLRGFSPDVSVGAGYMLLAPLLCRHYAMINLHPALPDGPAGTWQQVIWELIAERARESGVMVHVMIPEMDSGPAISYCRYPLTGGALDAGWAALGDRSSAEVKAGEGEDHPLFKAIRSAGLARERPFLVETLRAIAARRVDVAGAGRSAPLDLTAEVDAILGAP